MENDNSTDTTVQDDSNDDSSWANAEADYLNDKGYEAGVVDEEEDVEEDTKQTPEDETKDTKDTEDITPDAPETEADEEDPQSVYRDQRAIQREIEADKRAMREEIRKEMFNTPTEITDADGDPIRTVEDVMKLMNPTTQKAFTEEEALAWLFAAQQHREKQQSEENEKIDNITEVNLQIRDDSEAIMSKYKKLLSDMPELRQAIWDDYKATLVVDEDTGYIIDAPFSLKNFFERALQPYAEYQSRLQSEAEQRKKSEATAKRKQTQSDRQDIYSGGSGNTEDAEEKAWADAARSYYESN